MRNPMANVVVECPAYGGKVSLSFDEVKTETGEKSISTYLKPESIIKRCSCGKKVKAKFRSGRFTVIARDDCL